MNEISKGSKIFISGHNGMVGSACWRIFKEKGYNNLIGRTSRDLDLRNQDKVEDFFLKEKPEIVINAAARVGGIWANKEYPYEFLMDNMLIQNNLIQNSLKMDIKKFIFLGSSCVYPKLSPQPIKEEYLLTDSLEETNQWYSIAKISGIKLIEAVRKQYGKDYISVMPTNLYGPGDNYDLKTSHVLPAMIRKFHEAKLENHSKVFLWGSGSPLRDFLHVNDLAKAIYLLIMNRPKESIFNIGSGEEISIYELALLIQKVVGHNGEIKWDSSMPDGTMRKALDSSKIEKLGFKPEIELELGIRQLYKNFIL